MHIPTPCVAFTDVSTTNCGFPAHWQQDLLALFKPRADSDAKPLQIELHQPHAPQYEAIMLELIEHIIDVIFGPIFDAYRRYSWRLLIVSTIILFILISYLYWTHDS